MVDAVLLRQNLSGALIPWALNDDGTDPVADAATLAKLVQIKAVLDAILVASAAGPIALDAATLLALESITVTGTVAVSNPTANPETGLAKNATMTDGSQKSQVTNFPTTQAVSGTVGISGTVPISGTVAVSGAVAVGGAVAVTNLPSVQPVSGPLTDAQMRATSVPVSTGLAPLTDAQLRASAVPVSTGLTPLTDTQLRSTPVVTQAIETRSLTERMFAKAPAAGKALFLDTADLNFIYIAEAPTGDLLTATSAQGIQVTKDATGNPLGKVKVATGFAWNSRAGAAWL